MLRGLPVTQSLLWRTNKGPGLEAGKGGWKSAASRRASSGCLGSRAIVLAFPPPLGNVARLSTNGGGIGIARLEFSVDFRGVCGGTATVDTIASRRRLRAVMTPASDYSNLPYASARRLRIKWPPGVSPAAQGALVMGPAPGFLVNQAGLKQLHDQSHRRSRAGFGKFDAARLKRCRHVGRAALMIILSMLGRTIIWVDDALAVAGAIAA